MNPNPKMRVLLFIDSLTAGGAQRQLTGLARLLKSQGYVVKIVTYFNVPFYEDFLKQNDIEYECIRNSEKKLFRLFLVANAFRKFRPDIVIAYLDTPNILSILCRFFGHHYKLIVSERNTTQRLTFRDRLKFFLFRFADYIVPNSYAQSDFIKNHFPRLSPKIETITNFVDTGFFKPAENIGSKSVLNILSVGRIAPQKNVLRYIQAIDAVSKSGVQVQVNWYGNGYMNDGMSDQYSSYYVECLELIKALHLEDQFIFHQPSKDVLSLYQSCDLFCLPSVYEGFPNVVCEAMACAKPILASHIGDNEKIVRQGYNGFLFDPYSVDEIKNTILEYHKLAPELQRQMAVNSRDIALADFSATRFVSKYIRLISA